MVVEKAADEIRPRPGHRAGGFFVQATKYSENVYHSSYSVNQETISSNEWIEVKGGRVDVSGHSGKVVTHHMARIEANLDTSLFMWAAVLYTIYCNASVAARVSDKRAAMASVSEWFNPARMLHS